LTPLVMRSGRLAGRRVQNIEGITTDFPNTPVLCRPGDRQAMCAVADFLKAGRPHWDRILVRHIDSAQPLVGEFLTCLEKPLPWHFLENSNQSPYIPVTGDWDGYFRGLSGNFRRTLKNKSNRLARNGALEIRRYDSPRNLAEGLEAAFAVAERNWQGQQGSAVSSPGQAAFYRPFAGQAAQKGQLALYVLFVAEEPVAFEYNIVFRERVFSLKWGYDPRFGEFSPGALLKEAAHRDFFEEGVAEIDLLGSADFFKLRWTDQIRPYRDLHIHCGDPRLWPVYYYQAALLPQLRRARALKNYLTGSLSKGLPFFSGKG
ncbi:MAG TPA: GNAT family N-acetyltransferase, partial [Calditrichia bacterium]|nr:GNAT family N-acetyltransferase [Calditrichia bacterium]